MHDVMGIAVARAAAGELTLAAIPALQGTAQRGRDGAGPAAHIEYRAVRRLAQHHEAGIAGETARDLRGTVDAHCLLDHRLPGVGAGCRGILNASARFHGEVQVDRRRFDELLACGGVRCRTLRDRGA